MVVVILQIAAVALSLTACFFCGKLADERVSTISAYGGLPNLIKCILRRLGVLVQN